MAVLPAKMGAQNTHTCDHRARDTQRSPTAVEPLDHETKSFRLR